MANVVAVEPMPLQLMCTYKALRYDCIVDGEYTGILAVVTTYSM